MIQILEEGLEGRRRADEFQRLKEILHSTMQPPWKQEVSTGKSSI